MTNRFKWPRTGLIALLAVSFIGAPTLATARDRCDNQGYSSRNRQVYSRAGYNNDYRYSNRNAQYRDYRNDRYRNNSSYGYRDSGYRDGRYGDYREERSTGESAAIIGGGAAAGAAVGAIAGGGKGALIGAAVGGVGGLIYDRATKNKGNRW